MRKTALLIATAVLTATLTACSGSTGTTSDSTSKSNQQEAAATDTTTEARTAVQTEAQTKTQTEAQAAAQSSTAESEDGINVDKGLLNVEITIPADYAETYGFTFESQEEADTYAKEQGFKSVTLGDDGSVTLVMSKSQHKKMMEGLNKTIDEALKLYEKSEENRVVRERREEEQRRREEEVRKREELRRRKELEIAHIKELVNKADDYRIAQDIRAYIEAVIESGSEEATSEWIEWARKKADWYDPTIARNDEYLGIRDHGRSKEEKDLNRVSLWNSWGWL